MNACFLRCNGLFVVRILLLIGVFGMFVPLSGCASKQSDDTAQAEPYVASEFEDYGTDDIQVISDPLEPWNRFWFNFNDVFLIKIAKPVYAGYSYVMPQEFRNGISNVFYNLKAPLRVVNRILQGEFAQAWVELGKFIVNSTAGFGGLFDITKEKKIYVPYRVEGADFGTTLAVWGVPEGIYMVWPFFGPSSARDTVGLAADFAGSPLFLISEPVGPLTFWESVGVGAAFHFNELDGMIKTYEELTQGAVEPYAAMRDAYIRYRQSLK